MSVSPMIGLAEAEGTLVCPMAWQLSETSTADILAFRQRLASTLQRMVDEACAA